MIAPMRDQKLLQVLDATVDLERCAFHATGQRGGQLQKASDTHCAGVDGHQQGAVAERISLLSSGHWVFEQGALPCTRRHGRCADALVQRPGAATSPLGGGGSGGQSVAGGAPARKRAQATPVPANAVAWAMRALSVARSSRACDCARERARGRFWHPLACTDWKRPAARRD